MLDDYLPGFADDFTMTDELSNQLPAAPPFLADSLSDDFALPGEPPSIDDGMEGELSDDGLSDGTPDRSSDRLPDHSSNATPTHSPCTPPRRSHKKRHRPYLANPSVVKSNAHIVTHEISPRNIQIITRLNPLPCQRCASPTAERELIGYAGRLVCVGCFLEESADEREMANAQLTRPPRYIRARRYLESEEYVMSKAYGDDRESLEATGEVNCPEIVR